MAYNSYIEETTDTYKFNKKKNKIVKVKTRSGTNLQPVIKPSDDLGNPPITDGRKESENKLGEALILLDFLFLGLIFLAFSLRLQMESNSGLRTLLMVPIIIHIICNLIVLIASATANEYYWDIKSSSLYWQLKVRLFSLPFKFIAWTFKILINVGFRKGITDLLNGIETLENKTSKDFKEAGEVVRDE